MFSEEKTLNIFCTYWVLPLNKEQCANSNTMNLNLSKVNSTKKDCTYLSKCLKSKLSTARNKNEV